MSLRSARRPLTVVALGLISSFALVGFLHTTTGVRAWGAVTGQSCPFGGGQSPRQRDADRASQARALIGPNPAREKIGLCFTFDKTTREDVDQWAQTVGAKCAKARTSGELECAATGLRNVPSLERADGTLFFDFDAKSRLKRVTAQVSLKDPDAATKALEAVAQNIHNRAGGDIIFSGENTPQYLAGMLTQARTSFHYNDFYAKAQLTHIGDYYVLEQQYESLTF